VESPATSLTTLTLQPFAKLPGLRVLAWAGDALYASRGYTLLSARPAVDPNQWDVVGKFQPAEWRKVTAKFRLSSRLVRDGFHALARTPAGDLVGAVPGAIVWLTQGDSQFRITHLVQRGTRPLNLAVTPDGTLYFGEYFSNRERTEVHIYASSDRGATWQVAHSFSKGSIRHVHNIVWDRWGECLWVLTGDVGDECKVLRVSPDFRNVETVLEGNQQARAVSLVAREDAIYFASDTPLEANFIYRMERTGKLERVTAISSSVLYGCAVGNNLFFSTIVEPSQVNRSRKATIYGSGNGREWSRVAAWQKDAWPMALQYGSAILPSGENSTDVLAATGLAVRAHDDQALLWRVRR